MLQVMFFSFASIVLYICKQSYGGVLQSKEKRASVVILALTAYEATRTTAHSPPLGGVRTQNSLTKRRILRTKASPSYVDR